MDASDATKDSYGPIQHAHRALHLGREIHVARGVDDVDTMPKGLARLEKALLFFLGPKAGDGSGGDRDATLLLLLHPVRDGVAIIDITNLVDQAGVEKDPLRRRCLARINMRGNPNVARALERVLAVRRVQGRVDCGGIAHGRNGGGGGTKSAPFGVGARSL